MSGKVYALNLFNITDRGEYLAYMQAVGPNLAAHGGRPVAMGKLRNAVEGDIEPRQVLVVIEWESKEVFDAYRADPALADVHPRREKGTSSYVWHLFDRIDDLRPLLMDDPIE